MHGHGLSTAIQHVLLPSKYSNSGIATPHSEIELSKGTCLSPSAVFVRWAHIVQT